MGERLDRGRLDRINYKKLKGVLDKKYFKASRINISKKSRFYKNLLDIFYFCNTSKEIYYCLENNIKEKKKCLFCDKHVSTVLSQTCSIKCRNKLVSSNVDYVKRNLKTKETLLNNFGVTNVSQIEHVKQKREKTFLYKYNNKSYFGSTLHKERINETLNPSILYNEITNIDNLNKEYIESNFIKNEKLQVEECLKYFNFSITTLNRYKLRLSINYDNFFIDVRTQENDINKLFDNKFITNNRTLINPLEIDLLNHNCKFGIEYNGVLWHSYGNTYPYNIDINPDRHLNKTELVESKGYQLFHIFENEWKDANLKNIWINKINLKLNIMQNRIYARKCIIKEISQKESDIFINNNHLQGKSISNVRLGLFYNDELVQVLTFAKPRYEKYYEWELMRACSKTNSIVIGGFSKLLKYFEKKYKPISLISYGNRRWTDTNNNVYRKNGFEYVGKSEPNYFYFNLKEMILHSRVQFQKHKLKHKLHIYDEELTANENIFNNDYRIIYDCGNLIYKKVYNEKN